FVFFLSGCASSLSQNETSSGENNSVTQEIAKIEEISGQYDVKQNITLATCYAQIKEIKLYDERLYASLRTSMLNLVSEQAKLNSSKQYASAQTIQFIDSQQHDSVHILCQRVQQKLDQLMVKKMLSSLY
ncbi:TPA: hypothetical protein J1Z89_003356, partial [Escherichia coli]|nr:hypothetical protein [Escherichia coli]